MLRAFKRSFLRRACACLGRATPLVAVMHALGCGDLEVEAKSAREALATVSGPTWMLAAPMSQARVYHKATLLGSGRVLVA